MELTHRDNIDPEALAKWDELCRETTLAMQDHIMPYITPISHAVEDEWGRLEGTGAYIEFANKRLLLTNEHVVRDWEARQFAHQFSGCEDVFKLVKSPIAIEKHPIDCAAYAIEDSIWAMRQHAAAVVPNERISKRHQPVPGELLFFAGYPEKRSKSLYKHLITRATRMTTQEIPDVPSDLHDNYFLLNYSPARVQSVVPDQIVDVYEPHGLSGSLIWNTRRLECLLEGREWTSDLAQVTGLLCRWESQTSYVMAIRIEKVLDFLSKNT